MSLLPARFGMIGPALLLCFSLTIRPMCGHPASGIVVDAHGSIYFIDSGHAVFKIDRNRHRTIVKKVPDGQWLALDQVGHFSKSTPKYFERITPFGVLPALIYAGGGAPIVVADDGALYYGSGESNGDPMFPGGINLSRILPDGRQSAVSEQLRALLQSWDDGITGLAAGPDQAVYAATWTGVLKTKFDGTTTIIKHPIAVPGCDVDFADHKPGSKLPYLRGIVVLRDGTVYAAATSCHAVIEISRGGTVRTILKSERPWTPTGIAARGNDLYVLEYTNANGPPTEGWRPRIRMIDNEMRISTILSLE